MAAAHGDGGGHEEVTRQYKVEFTLKYGCNPHQKPAQVLSLHGSTLPFRVLNGTPGYINLLDALNAWQLVLELRAALQLPAAASFKHVSPAGAAISVPLSDELREVYEVGASELTPLATAFVRARNADPKSSFGDFLAFSDRVDLATARLVKREVSDGVIAPDFEPAALELLRSKQDGRFLVLQGDAAYRAPEVEYREVFGVALAQRRNTARISHELFNSLVTRNRALTPDAVRDLLVATITAKFTQSNSVVLALDGQVIGVGAGQQSRIDCVRLAGSKADVWHLRRHPRVRALPLREGLSRAERVNARTLLIQGGMAAPEERGWRAQLAPAAQQQPPAPLSAEEKQSFLATLRGVALSSDAFFPFRDSVDEAAKHGVRFIAQPGRSVEDAAVAQAADEYDMVMALTDLRLFHH